MHFLLGHIHTRISIFFNRLMLIVNLFLVTSANRYRRRVTSLQILTIDQFFRHQEMLHASLTYMWQWPNWLLLKSFVCNSPHRRLRIPFREEIWWQHTTKSTFLAPGMLDS